MKKSRFAIGLLAVANIGAQPAQAAWCDGRGWQDISTAPRDGTSIELCNQWGIMPTYALCKWTKTRIVNGETYTFGPDWVDVLDNSRGVIDGQHLSWRPYTGDPAHYEDPTHGAQNTPAYWMR